MHEIVINLEELLWFVTLLGAVFGVFVYLRKGITPITRPFKELKELQLHTQVCELKFADYNERFDELNADIREIMRSQMLLLKHVETGNCTGEVAEGRKHLENYLINKE